MVIKNIGTLFETDHKPWFCVEGQVQNNLPAIEGVFFGKQNDIFTLFREQVGCVFGENNVYATTDRIVLPLLCNSYTHLVCKGSREFKIGDVFIH